MINAKEELLKILKVHQVKIKCAGIDYSGLQKNITLPVGYSDADLEQFLQELDFSYDNEYGTQRLHGLVWLDNGEWLERGEYDGSEWWECRCLPEIPEYLKG